MKRVLFGYKGGFPLEQETLIQIQKAYSVDMLEALFALWGVSPTGKYLIKTATNDTDDGWIIAPFDITVINPLDGSEMQISKPQLLRLKHNGGGSRIRIRDLRAGDDGDLEYADGQPKKVYEELIGELVTTGGEFLVSDFIPLDSILELTAGISNNSSEINTVKENYLPRDGSKPMTGDLDLGSNQISKLDTNESFSAIVRSADFNLGYSGRRGQIYPDRPIGRALVDGGDTLNLNYSNDWDKTTIFGNLNFPSVQQIQNRENVPLFIDRNGNVSKGVIGESVITPDATESVKGKAEIATQNEVNTTFDRTRIVTPGTLRGYISSNLRYTYGSVRTTSRSQQGFNDFNRNYAHIFPPFGYRMSNLMAFIPSIMWIQYSGDVDGNDLLYCRYTRRSDRIVVIAQNSENGGDSWINYLAIWRK